MALRLWRAHGLGNDYLVLEQGPPMTASLAREICDRHRGVGGDGVLEPVPGESADYGVRIWNPDGSVAEKSGNGLRIYARWLVDRRSAPAAFSVWTGFDRVECQVGPDLITVEMGRASLDPAAVPVTADAPVQDDPWTVAGTDLQLTAIGVGNPHCVAFVDVEDLDDLPWRTWGEALEVHPRFPNRTNVQVARVVDGSTLELRIWERGAGPTLASGSSSCAVAAAAVATGRVRPGTLELRMPGGILRVTVSPCLQIRLEGPVEPVGLIEVDPRWLAARIEE